MVYSTNVLYLSVANKYILAIIEYTLAFTSYQNMSFSPLQFVYFRY